MAKKKSDFDEQAEKIEAANRAAEEKLLGSTLLVGGVALGTVESVKIEPAEPSLKAVVELHESASNWNYKGRTCAIYARLDCPSGPPDLGWTPVRTVDTPTFAMEVGTCHNFHMDDLEPGTAKARRRLVADVVFDAEAWGKAKDLPGVKLNVYGFDVEGMV
jgi:hypothetical protein